ncbi:hypothetical protein ACFW91_25150 [Streptomyces asoensis]|uniref:hypothetical protein n=1 Tax=Streptomyces asoensis TaxID=249586 RepID=UPI0036B682C7
MTSDLRDLPHRLHTALQTATAMLDLPLESRHLEALATELTPFVRAVCAEALAETAESTPIPYATVSVDEQAGVETTEYAGCVRRISVDVDHDSPAAVLAEELRRHPDVIATDIPNATYLGLTIRPRTAAAWQWWQRKLNLPFSAITVQGTDAYACCELGGVAIHLRGEDTGTLMSPDVRARQGLDVDLDSPAGTVAAKARRQPDVTSIEISNAHTVTVTVRATALVDWQWWLTQLGAAATTVLFDGDTATVTGSKDGATVHLRGDGCRTFYEDEVAAHLAGLTASTT